MSSATTLLGLIKHLTHVETLWFAELLTGVTRAEHGLPDTPAESLHLEPADTVASSNRLPGGLRAISTAICGHDLDDVVTGHRFRPITLRWILLHCIRETAQHVGHADILREQTLVERNGPGPAPSDTRICRGEIAVRGFVVGP